MFPNFKRVLKDRRRLLLIYSLSNIAMLWMYIGLFPSFSKQAASLEELIKSYPESLLKAFNFDIASFNTIEGFLSTEQFSFVWPLILMFMVIGFSGYAIAGEIEKGTIEILLSQPITRAKLFLARYFAGFFMLIIFVILSVYPIIPLCRIYDIAYDVQSINLMAIISLFFSWAIYSISMMFSSMFSDRGKVFFLSGMLFVIMYVLNIVASIKESLSDLKYGSFFYYFNSTKALVHSEIDNLSLFVFIGVAIVFTIVAFFWFKKRDITT